jgi:hypothetical protein
MALLTNSDRHILKATHTPLKLEKSEEAKLSRALDKASYVRSLQLPAGEVDLVHRKAVASGASSVPEPVWGILKRFEPQLLAVLEPKPSVLADIPIEQLLAFGQAVIDHRKSLLDVAQQPPTASAGSGTVVPAPAIDPASGAGNAGPSLAGVQMAVKAMEVQASGSQDAAISTFAASLHFAVSASNAFKNAVAVNPIGMLHLERIETAPAGIERGELVATIPLAPQETTNVVQKEWTVTSQEYSSIVTDFLENYSEKGVTEKTELSEATESQSKHSQQLGLSASASGTYGFVTFATSATFGTNTEEQNSQKESRQHAAEMTQKASSRVRKERKVTIETTSVVGKEDTTTRTLTNPSQTDTMRIDYYSMMRKWRVRLLQYGLRMTYDIALPEPGATLRQMHARLFDIEQQLKRPFIFQIDPKTSDSDLLSIADQAGIAIDLLPAASYIESQTVAIPDSSAHYQGGKFAFSIKDGYQVETIEVSGFGGQVDKNTYAGLTFPADEVYIHNTTWGGAWDDGHIGTQYEKSFLPKRVGQSGNLEIFFLSNYSKWGDADAQLMAVLTDERKRVWRQGVLQAIFNAHRDYYYSNLQALSQERDALRARLEGVDTLTLRREERDEIMKGVLRWLLGPSFQFMPQEVIDSFTNSFAAAAKKANPQLTPDDIDTMLSQGQGFAGNTLGLNTSAWSTMLAYQEMVKFLHQAIEWENLLYLMYPYFWDIPIAWDFVRTLQHPDPTREQFLRAGSARVVLTIRPGYEGDFAAFVDKGDLSVVLNGDHPYLTIGNELQARANANYPGIPPANPEPNPRPLLTPLHRKAWSDMQELIRALDVYKQGSESYPTTKQGLSVLKPLDPKKPLPTADPWGNPYSYKSPGAYNDYELASLGADGKPGGEGDNADVTSWADASLIAEWFDYTPTHGTDIQVTTALPQMA